MGPTLIMSPEILLWRQALFFRTDQYLGEETRKGRGQDQAGDPGRNQADHGERHLPSPARLPLHIRRPHLHARVSEG